MKFMKYLLVIVLAMILVACGGGGGSSGNETNGAVTPVNPVTPVTPVVSENINVAKIKINSNASVLNADGTSSVTFTVFALTSGNASVSGATIDLSAINGVVLNKSSVVTTEIGAAVTMIADSSDQTKRISTLTASCSGCSASPATAQININGASIGLANSSGSLLVGGTGSALSATVKNIFGVGISGVTVSFAATDATILALSGPTGVTNDLGVAEVTVSGLKEGNSSINVSALGNAKSQAYTSGVVTAVLSVTSPANKSVLVTNIAKPITVSAPGASSVTFATTMGTFPNGLSQSVSVMNGSASINFTSTQAGTATLTMIDDKSRSASLTLVVSPPVSAANKILFSASQTTLPIATAGSQSSLTLTARAISSNGVTDQAVANVPIAFSMTGGPGAGEFLTPALAYTDSTGKAIATFTAGTGASISNGIVISAMIQGSSSPIVTTGTLPSSNNAQITIGGQALSVAFGPASELGESSDKTLYIQAYSVQVTDANNNPVRDQVVTLRMRPVAFSLGTPCTVTATYCSEDANGNGSLDAGEDGMRIATTVATAGSCPSVPPATVFGRKDTNLTPQNSDGGGVPSTVITNASGIAAFDLTYLKGSALWDVNKLTATVSSNGTESSKSTTFRLPAGIKDASADGLTCNLPASPYSF